MARVLIIDDQRIPRLTVGAALQEAGHEVVAEADGASGLAKAGSWAPDVIVLDVHMPEMDGFAVVERLKQNPRTAPIPVIFLTATAPTDELVVRGLDLGAYDFLSKGCSKAELLARVGVMSRIKRSNDELTALARVSDTLLRTLDPQELSRQFLEQTLDVFRADAGLLVVARNDGLPAIRVGSGIDPSDTLFELLTDSLLMGLTGGEDAEILALAELQGPAGALIRRLNLGSGVAVRLDHRDRPPSLLAAFTRGKDRFRRESDAPLLQLLARQATIAMDNALLHAQTREQAHALALQAEELERAMGERSRFFASMSHELRTPINAVMGYNQLLEDGTYGDVSAKQRDILRKVSRSASHLLELINDILDISKIEAGKLEICYEPTDLVQLVRDTLTSVELPAQAKGLALTVRSPEQVRIQTDPARVRQVVLNLLANAVKFTDEGEVTIKIIPPEPEPANPADGWAEIQVTDTGPGIAPEDQQRIFEEFEQADSGVTHGGTGLGLAISRKLAHLLGGDLALHSQPGVGSTFTLRLPTNSLNRPQNTAPSFSNA